MDEKYKNEPWPYIFALPCVGAIVQRERDGVKQFLVQTRWNLKRDKRYSGTIEFPAGILDKRFESIFDALAREIIEETGLKLKKSIQGTPGEVTTTGRDDSTQGFQPFYCAQQLAGDYPWVGSFFVCEVEDGEPTAQAGENKNPRWVNEAEIRDMVENHPEQIFGLQLPVWRHYFNLH